MSSLPKSVRLVEVGPRDGLQNEKQAIPASTKIELIDRLASTGLQVVEATSFVSPRWVPQLADAAEVMAGISRKAGVRYPVLVPNLEGLDRAMASGCTDIAVFTAASETFNQKNINASIDESLARIEPVVERALENNIPVRAYVSCVLGCPYEGEIDTGIVADVSKRLIDLGCEEISLGDTIGAGTPGEAQAMVEAVAKKTSMERLAVHFHDTRGQALANIFACLQLGVSVIDASVSGLGGCPYAKGATGNVATEDVVYMLNGLGIETGVDLDALVETGLFISDILDRGPGSRHGQMAWRRREQQTST